MLFLRKEVVACYTSYSFVEYYFATEDSNKICTVVALNAGSVRFVEAQVPNLSDATPLNRAEYAYLWGHVRWFGSAPYVYPMEIQCRVCRTHHLWIMRCCRMCGERW